MLDELNEQAMHAILNLMAAGFRVFVLDDPAYPHSLVYVRQIGSVRDLIRVYGPDECEAVRMVHKNMTRQVDGTTPEVVSAVLGWLS